MAEVDFLLKSARASIQADRKPDNLCLLSNDHSHIEGALRCYNQALENLDDDSVMKAAIIREIKKIHPNFEATSGFQSPAHRIWDLDVAAIDSVVNKDFVGALEKRTEIFDDILERKVQNLYVELLSR